MQTDRILIETADAFAAEGVLLQHESVRWVHIVTATQLRVKYRPNKATPEALAARVNGSIVNETTTDL